MTAVIINAVPAGLFFASTHVIAVIVIVCVLISVVRELIGSGRRADDA